ncbi:MAG: glycosyltransferase family protein [Polyangiales bacterium]
MARVAYFVHGRGRGHASRARAVLPRLRADGHDVQVLTGGQALELLGDEPTLRAIRACVPGPGLARVWTARLAHDLGVLASMRPDVVVSDGDGPSIHAALALRLPRLAVGHGLLFGHTTLPSSLPRTARWREAVNAASSSWPAARRVVVHFAPAEARTLGTVVARPDLAPNLAHTGEGRFVLAYFRDGNGERWLRALVARGHRVVAFGRESMPDGVERRDPSHAAFAEALTRCTAVVGSAGNHLPAECALLGVPMLALHREGDPEHAMNAALVAHAGIGLAGAIEAPTAPLLEALERFRVAPRVMAREMSTASEAVAAEVMRAVSARDSRRAPPREERLG